MANKEDYKAENIKVLEGLEGVRHRPAMYIGSTGKQGLHHLVYEVVDNSVDEAMAGFCDTIEVTLNKDGSVTVIDNGRGIPVEPHPVYKRPGIEITFWPDESIFSATVFDYSILETRFREIAFLNKGVKIKLDDEKSGKKETFFYEGGLVEFVKWVNKSKEALHKPIYFTKTSGGVIVECAVQYNSSYQENVLGFVNTINTVEGGTHVVGFRTALTRAINDYGNKNKIIKGENLTGDDVREGLTAILS